VPEPATIPDFFQEETSDALRSQVDWLTREVGLDDAFFMKLLRTDAQTFSGWRRFGADLPPAGEETLRRFWRTTLHPLSSLIFDAARVRELFRFAAPARSGREKAALTPPSTGSSLKEYLERPGASRSRRWTAG
jgi:hypothetical protein